MPQDANRLGILRDDGLRNASIDHRALSGTKIDQNSTRRKRKSPASRTMKLRLCRLTSIIHDAIVATRVRSPIINMTANTAAMPKRITWPMMEPVAKWIDQFHGRANCSICTARGSTPSSV